MEAGVLAALWGRGQTFYVFSRDFGFPTSTNALFLMVQHQKLPFFSFSRVGLENHLFSVGCDEKLSCYYIEQSRVLMV